MPVNATCRKTPIARSALDKNLMPGHPLEGNPVDEGTTRRGTDIHPEIKFVVPRLPAVLINHERHSQRSLKAAILMVMVCYSEKTQIKTREGTQNTGATYELPVSLS